jgi:hypothetical protein
MSKGCRRSVGFFLRKEVSEPRRSEWRPPIPKQPTKPQATAKVAPTNTGVGPDFGFVDAVVKAVGTGDVGMKKLFPNL